MKLKTGAKKKTPSMETKRTASSIDTGDSDAAAALTEISADGPKEKQNNENETEETEKAVIEVGREIVPVAEADPVFEPGPDEEDDVDELDLLEDEDEEERPKLAEDYYEIEAIRRRRVRKGQLQYLIKWRGWPETDNTWEPVENLQSCVDVLEAFEEDLRSGKSFKKRKRKSGGSLTLPKKKQPRLTQANYNGVGGQSSSPALVNTGAFNFSTVGSQIAGLVLEGQSSGDANNDKSTQHMNDSNRLANGLKQIDGRLEETEYDPKLSELKGAVSSNDVHADRLTIHFQEMKAPDDNDATHSKAGNVVPTQSDRRTGSRRRKSGSVKRFQQDLAASKPANESNSVPIFTFGGSDSTGQVRIGDSTYINRVEGSRNPSPFVKILKAINFSASVSDNVQDVAVTFVALRSDGREVTVDNKFLKANDPLLLINFYEQNLKYNPQ